MISIVAEYTTDRAMMDQMDSIMMNLTPQDEPYFEYILIQDKDVHCEPEGKDFITNAVQGRFPIKIVESDLKYKEMVHKDSTLIFVLDGCVRSPDFIETIYQLMDNIGPACILPRILPDRTTFSPSLSQVTEVNGVTIKYQNASNGGGGMNYILPLDSVGVEVPDYQLHSGIIIERPEYERILTVTIDANDIKTEVIDE